MSKRRKKGPGRESPLANNNGNGLNASEPLRPDSDKDADPAGNDKLIEQVRQIIAATPEVRPEKVGPLKEAVEQGTYEIDARKLANALITKLILDP